MFLVTYMELLADCLPVALPHHVIHLLLPRLVLNNVLSVHPHHYPPPFHSGLKKKIRFPLRSLSICDIFRSWRSLVESTAPLPDVRLLSVCPLPHFLFTLLSLSADFSKSHRLGKLDTVYSLNSIVYSEYCIVNSVQWVVYSVNCKL